MSDGIITAVWLYMPPGTEPVGECHETTLVTLTDVRELVERLRDPYVMEAHQIHNGRPHCFNEWSGKDTVDHQVTIGVFDGFGYIEFIDSTHFVQLIGDPASPE